MKIDEIKLQNLKRLCKRDNINTGAELGRAIGLSGDSAKSTGSQLLNGTRKIVGKTLKDLCNLFNVNENEFLAQSDATIPSTQPQQQPTDMNLLFKIIEEQNKRIDEQGKRIDEQGNRISEQGKRIDAAIKISEDFTDAQKQMWQRINSIQDLLDAQHGKMKKAADSGDLKALG